MAATQDLELDQGAYWSREIEWTDDTEAAVDVTGYTARMQIRRKVQSTETLLELTTENGRITLGGTALPQIMLEIGATASAELPATPFDHRWYYDLELLPAGDDDLAIRLMQGRFIVSPEVTRED